MSSNIQLGRRIQALRKDAKKTQADLAEATGLSDNYIALLECGKRSPSIETLERIARALNVNVSHLFHFSKDDKGVSNKDLLNSLIKLNKNKNTDELKLLLELTHLLKNYEIKSK